jgi:hypothetical protein
LIKEQPQLPAKVLEINFNFSFDMDDDN